MTKTMIVTAELERIVQRNRKVTRRTGELKMGKYRQTKKDLNKEHSKK